MDCYPSSWEYIQPGTKSDDYLPTRIPLVHKKYIMRFEKLGFKKFGSLGVAVVGGKYGGIFVVPPQKCPHMPHFTAIPTDPEILNHGKLSTLNLVMLTILTTFTTNNAYKGNVVVVVSVVSYEKR